jgi:hypothetical protein
VRCRSCGVEGTETCSDCYGIPFEGSKFRGGTGDRFEIGSNSGLCGDDNDLFGFGWSYHYLDSGWYRLRRVGLFRRLSARAKVFFREEPRTDEVVEGDG